MMKRNLLSGVFFFLLTGVALSANAMNPAELLPDESNTVEIFKKSSSKVVYVHRLATVLDHSYQLLTAPAGTGSGIIWDANGHVVTNYHVIKGADKLAVTIGKLTVPAKVIGVEPRKDIAVLSITSKKVLAELQSFTPFEMAETKDLLVGQKAIAIGNPFGLDHSLTVGVISALGRQVPGIGGVKIPDMIQTDASINPGNSGGPLLDSAGRLIGLNSAIFSQTGNSAGVGFAVPADDIVRIVSQIIKHGRVVLSGIGITRVDPRIAERLGVQKGILVADVLPNTPAFRAGLKGTFRDALGRIKLGDIIIALNDHPVDTYDAMYNLLNEINIGEKIHVKVLRDGHFINYTMNTIDIAGI